MSCANAKSAILLAAALTAVIAGSNSAVAQQDDKSGGPRVVYRNPTPSVSDPGLTIDVFWCSGDELAPGRAISAAELAASYATIAKIGVLEVLAAPVNEVRTRPIERTVFTRIFDPSDILRAADRPIARFDPKDARLDRFARLVILRGLNPAVESHVRADIYSPNYLAVYVCSDLDTSKFVGRLFFQVKDPWQTMDVKKALSAVREKYPGVTVASDVEVVGAKAPSSSELRYFFKDDETLATRVAAEIGSKIQSKIVLKQVPGYEGRVRPGTLEAWISP